MTGLWRSGQEERDKATHVMNAWIACLLHGNLVIGIDTGEDKDTQIGEYSRMKYKKMERLILLVIFFLSLSLRHIVSKCYQWHRFDQIGSAYLNNYDL